MLLGENLPLASACIKYFRIACGGAINAQGLTPGIRPIHMPEPGLR